MTNLPYRPYYRSFNRPFYGSFNRPFYGAYNRPFYRSYYPYYRGYRPGFYAGFGYPYRYGYYGYPYRYSYYAYPYNYPYNYTYFNDYSTTSHDYSNTSSDYSNTSSSVTVVPRYDYGGLRIKDAPDDAQVFVDGNYMGRAGSFDSSSQAMTLAPGSHRVEVHAPGLAPVTANVHVIPGQTITFRTGLK